MVGVSLVFLVVRALTAVAAVVLASRHLTDHLFDPLLWRSLPAQAIPVGMFLLVLNVYNRVDALMLARMTDLEQAGYYGAAYPIYEGFTYAAAVISAVIAPRLSRLWVSAPREYRQLAGRAALSAGALGVMVALVAWPLTPFVLALVFKSSYAPALPTLRWLLVGLPAIYVIWVLHSVAISASKPQVLVVVTAAGAVFNIGLNLWLIPRYSHTGAAIATVISEFVVGAMMLAALRGPIALSRPARVSLENGRD